MMMSCYWYENCAVVCCWNYQGVLVGWQNYNKSRIHSSRGARSIEITLDSLLIFVGEIARASGGVIGTSECFGDVRFVCCVLWQEAQLSPRDRAMRRVN